MYYRLIETITRDHIRDHLRAALDVAETELELLEQGLKIPSPKMFDTASYVGGVVGLTGKTDFPALSLNCATKIISPTNENLYTYRYDGQITWMVQGDNPRQVEQQAKGYGAALEAIIRAHSVYPHADNYDVSALPFTFVEFAYLRTEFFGAAATELAVPKGKTTRIWVDGGRIEIAWSASEPGTGQHG